MNRIAYNVYGKGYIEDDVDMFMRDNTDREVVPGEFRITNEDYAAFVEFMSDKDVEWQSETKLLLAKLKEAAEAERYTETVGDYLTAIEENLDDDVQEALKLYKKELSELIENEIVLRRAYNQGVVVQNLAKDADVREAMELFADMERYDEILTGKDTDRK